MNNVIELYNNINDLFILLHSIPLLLKKLWWMFVWERRDYWKYYQDRTIYIYRRRTSWLYKWGMIPTSSLHLNSNECVLCKCQSEYWTISLCAVSLFYNIRDSLISKFDKKVLIVSWCTKSIFFCNYNEAIIFLN